MAMKTPGVYIVEKNAFPNSVVEVATAVPAFIGYTEKADNKGKSLTNKPMRITSMVEFHSYFGGAPKAIFEIAALSGGAPVAAEGKNQKAAAPENPPPAAGESDFSQGGDDYIVKQSAGDFLLYRCMRLFYQNGGGPCYIVSVGNYGENAADKKSKIDKKDLLAGITPLLKEQEPTMVVVPETVRLANVDDSNSIHQAMLMHCGEKMKNRFAILDIWQGDQTQNDSDCVEIFRGKLGVNFLDFAAAYYPWIDTTIVDDSDLNFGCISSDDKYELLKKLMKADIGISKGADAERQAKLAPLAARIDKIGADWGAEVTEKTEDKKLEQVMALNKQLDSSLVEMSSIYRKIRSAIREKLNRLPPAAAMAGVYTMVDNSRGVWKAPANVSLNAVVKPTVNISHEEQELLNVDPQGKSVNAIRTFIGEGTLVWGARTLDGNSLDWRYINVRRTMIMLEESIRLAAKAYVFEPNVANTWVTVRGMIRNFLTGIWKRGGLAGAVPDDAFQVFVGLGETMTPEDILEGILRVTVLVAVTRPAEFIEITFQQKMQES